MWVKLDDGFFRGPKARAAGKDGRALYLAGLCFSAASLTDGRITATDLPLIAAEAEVNGRRTAARLVDVGFWHADGHDCDRCAQPGPGAWIVHDYVTMNPTKDKVVAEREAGAERQRRSRESRRDRKRDGRRDKGVTNGVSAGDPSRPGSHSSDSWRDPQPPDEAGGPPCDAGCDLGWLPDPDDAARVVPCPTCRTSTRTA